MNDKRFFHLRGFDEILSCGVASCKKRLIREVILFRRKRTADVAGTIGVTRLRRESVFG